VANIATHAALTATHGVTGAVVGTTDTQALSAKTLTTPTISATGWTNANHAHAAANSGGAIPWANIDKTTSSIADITTRAVANLSDGSNVPLLNAANTFTAANIFKNTANSTAAFAVKTAGNTALINFNTTAESAWMKGSNATQLLVLQQTGAGDAFYVLSGTSYFGGNVGVGAAADALYKIYGYANPTDAGTVAYGGFFEAKATNTASRSALTSGVTFAAKAQGTANHTGMLMGVGGYAGTTGASAITASAARSFYGYINCNNGQTVTSGAIFYAAAQAGSGNVATHDGFYCEALVGGSAAYAFRQVGTSNTNYFAGPTRSANISPIATNTSQLGDSTHGWTKLVLHDGTDEWEVVVDVTGALTTTKV